MEEYEKKILDMCRKYTIIFIYVSKKGEPNTHKIIKELLKEKNVVVPKVHGKDILPIEIKSFEDIKKGSFGVLEPSNDNIIAKEKIELFIIPGTTFDKKGNRKGHGFGYFDRFLKKVKTKKLGLCFSSQIKEIMPNPWDIPVDEVLIVDE